MPVAQDNKDLFAPPTPDELKSAAADKDLFAPPSKEELAKASNNRPGVAETFAEHAGNHAAMGYLPQLYAVAQQYNPIRQISKAIEEAPRPGDDKRSFGDVLSEARQKGQNDYVNDRDAVVRRLKSGEEENPTSSTAGKIVGGIGGALLTPMPAMGMAKGIIPAAIRGGAYGGAQGLLTNPGDRTGEVDPLQAEDRASNAAKGIGVGALTGGLFGGAEKSFRAVGSMPETASEFAQNQAIRGFGARSKDVRVLEGKQQTAELGQFGIDKGLIKAGDTVEDVARKAGEFKKQAGDRLDKVYSQANERIAANRGSQPELPGMVDDLQRRTDVPMQVELNGKPPETMRASEVHPNEQTFLSPLPQRQTDLFNPPRGSDLTPMAQKMELDRMSKGEISSLGQQGEIEGTGLIPRTHAEATRPVMVGDKGQLDMLPAQVESAIDQSKMGFNPVRDKEEILAAAKKDLGETEGGGAALNRLSKYLDEVAERHGDKTLDPRTANEIKTAVDKTINYSRQPFTKEPAAESTFSSARKVLADKIDAHIDELGKLSGDPSAAQALKEANRDYGMSKKIEEMATNRTGMDKANRMIGLTDTNAGVGGGLVRAAMHGTPMQIAGTAAATAVANKVGRTYGSGLLAQGGDVASKVLPYTGIPAAGKGAADLMNTLSPEVIARFLSGTSSTNSVDDRSRNPPELDRMSSTPAIEKVEKRGLIKKSGGR